MASNLESVASSEVFAHPAQKERVVCDRLLSQHTFIFLVGTLRCRKSACMQIGEDCVTKYRHHKESSGCNEMVMQSHMSLVKGNGL